MTVASGRVPRAALQIEKRRGAQLTVLTSTAKASGVRNLVAERMVTHGEGLVAVICVVCIAPSFDNIAGEGFPSMLKRLCYIGAGEIMPIRADSAQRRA